MIKFSIQWVLLQGIRGAIRTPSETPSWSILTQYKNIKNDFDRKWSDFELTKDTPYLTTQINYRMSCEYLGVNLPCYNGTQLCKVWSYSWLRTNGTSSIWHDDWGEPLGVTAAFQPVGFRNFRHTSKPRHLNLVESLGGWDPFALKFKAVILRFW